MAVSYVQSVGIFQVYGSIETIHLPNPSTAKNTLILTAVIYTANFSLATPSGFTQFAYVTDGAHFSYYAFSRFSTGEQSVTFSVPSVLASWVLAEWAGCGNAPFQSTYTYIPYNTSVDSNLTCVSDGSVTIVDEWWMSFNHTLPTNSGFTAGPSTNQYSRYRANFYNATPINSGTVTHFLDSTTDGSSLGAFAYNLKPGVYVTPPIVSTLIDNISFNDNQYNEMPITVITYPPVQSTLDDSFDFNDFNTSTISVIPVLSNLSDTFLFADEIAEILSIPCANVDKTDSFNFSDSVVSHTAVVVIPTLDILLPIISTQTLPKQNNTIQANECGLRINFLQGNSTLDFTGATVHFIVSDGVTRKAFLCGIDSSNTYPYRIMDGTTFTTAGPYSIQLTYEKNSLRCSSPISSIKVLPNL